MAITNPWLEIFKRENQNMEGTKVEYFKPIPLKQLDSTPAVTGELLKDYYTSRRTATRDLELEGYGQGRLVARYEGIRNKPSVWFYPDEANIPANKRAIMQSEILFTVANAPAILAPVVAGVKGRRNISANLNLAKQHIKHQDAKRFIRLINKMASGEADYFAGLPMRLDIPTTSNQPHSKSHIKNFIQTQKRTKFPGMEGDPNYRSMPNLYADYKAKFGELPKDIPQEIVRAKRTGTTKAGEPNFGIQRMSDRAKTQRKAGVKRGSNIDWSNSDSKNYYKAEQKSNRAKNKVLGLTATEGWIIEHNIPVKSRYWKVWGKKGNQNSDPNNIFSWKDPVSVRQKGAVEKRLNTLKGEPFASKYDRRSKEMVILHIDSNTEVKRFKLGTDFEPLIKNLMRDEKLGLFERTWNAR